MSYVGIIGGSGLYQMEGVEVKEWKKVETPYGSPSDEIMLGTLNGVNIAFLPRHGRGHKITPSEINYRANIWAMKSLGVEQIISVSAVGSMKEEIDRGHIVIIDQFVDRTRMRPSTFFHDGIVAHVSFAEPICSDIAKTLYDAAKDVGATVHKGGAYVCIEGPMFSSKAESKIYRTWGVDVIGMTNYQEAKLAREAEICYATIALATDYDCWHESEEDVNALAVVEVMNKNVITAKKIINAAIGKLPKHRDCACSKSLEFAIVTDKKLIPETTKKRLKPIIGRYVD